MKKLASFVLALAMAAVCAAPAMAAGNQITESTSNSCDTKVTFTIDPAYTVTIPSEVTLEKKEGKTVTYEKDLTLKASNVRLNQGKKLQVTIPDNSVLQLSAGSATLNYTITNDNGINVGAGSVAATFTTQAADQTATLHIKANDPPFAGDYSGTLKFTIAVVNAT
ncbi:hypothetical protein [uncultured Gemmiger sp.]|uniref:hypothetical protein n=1 Tax=uncultured Gemmiger sp. TaxID=1623490 RepID=UPI0027DC7844|nr:hypothetical protein [uncultured Gemmiger sp.]